MLREAIAWLDAVRPRSLILRRHCSFLRFHPRSEVMRAEQAPAALRAVCAAVRARDLFCRAIMARRNHA
jgi:hypothetical protein